MLLKQRDLDEVSRLLAKFKPVVGFYEIDFLVPEVLNRLQYSKSLFLRMKAICSDATVQEQVGKALAQLTRAIPDTRGPTAAEMAKEYLSQISSQCDSSFIEKIDQVLEESKSLRGRIDIDETRKLLNKASQIFQTIVGTKGILFHFSIRGVLHVTEKSTGAAVLRPASELDVILMPFERDLGELFKIGEATVESISDWGNHVKEQKVRHTEIFSQLTQAKASRFQASAAMWATWFQVAVIVLTIVLVVASYRAGLYLEKKELEDTVRKLEESVQTSLRNEKALQEKIADLTSKKIKPAVDRGNVVH
jgi:hypothetical protein